MAKIKQKISITDLEDSLIRRQWDNERGRWYFSITDIMGVLTESVDARNYWKALKNRLKETNYQLVMDCNQLKMRASDGKSYMVDVADAGTIIKIIQIIAPYNTPAFKSWFDHIDIQGSVKSPSSDSQILSSTSLENQILDSLTNKLSPTLEPGADIYEEKNSLVVKIILPGIDPEKIIITTSMNTLIIKGVRIKETISEKNYLYQELLWGEFYKEIKLPTLVDVDNVEVLEFHGLITVRLPKIDLDKKRFLKIKSV